MELNDSNYYSAEADAHYMSFSQYKAWRECPAKKFAEIFNGWKPATEADHYIVGRYAHTAILEPHRLDEFAANNPQMFKKDGTKYAKYSDIDATVAAFNSQPVFRKAVEMSGEDKEQTLYFRLGGIPWKARIDNLRHKAKAFDDLKFMGSLEDRWMVQNGRSVKVPWHKAYGYQEQMAVYQLAIFQTVGDWYTPNILAATKQAPADYQWLYYDLDYWQSEFDAITERIGEEVQVIEEIKRGEEEPWRCETCEFCRQTKVIAKPIIPQP